MLVVAGWMMGQHFSAGFDKRLASCRSLQRGIHRLEAGLRTHQEFWQMITGMELQGREGQALKLAGEKIRQGADPDQEFWYQVFDQWPQEDRSQFAAGFTQLARGDRMLREAQLAELQRYIAQRIETLQQEKSSCSRLYRNLGALLGTAAAIMVL